MNRLRLLASLVAVVCIFLLSGTSCLLGDQNYIATQAALAGEKAVAAGKTQAAAVGQTAVAAGKTEVADLGKTAVAAGKTEVADLGKTALAAGKTEAANLGKTALAVGGTEGVHLKETAQAVVGTQGVSVFGTLIARQVQNGILGRAKSWVDAQVPYNADNFRDGYRTDSSGLVSYAWQLKKDGVAVSPDTLLLGTVYARDIPVSELQAGDILNNKRAGNAGHAVIFVGWADESHTTFTAYEENGGPDYGKAVQTLLTLVPEGAGHTIKEYAASAPGPWYAQTYVATP